MNDLSTLPKPSQILTHELLIRYPKVKFAPKDRYLIAKFNRLVDLKIPELIDALNCFETYDNELLIHIKIMLTYFSNILAGGQANYPSDLMLNFLISNFEKEQYQKYTSQHQGHVNKVNQSPTKPRVAYGKTSKIDSNVFLQRKKFINNVNYYQEIIPIFGRVSILPLITELLYLPFADKSVTKTVIGQMNTHYLSSAYQDNIKSIEVGIEQLFLMVNSVWVK